MVDMRLEKLRQLDLNLLVIFAVVAEEKSVTKASARLLLSQPAVSRALQRARCVFQDELVIRSSSGLELTMRGRKILEELELLLPGIEGLVVPSIFDPKKERSNFRISGADNVCIALLPHLCRRYTTAPYKVNFEFIPWHADVVDLLERGKLDLILHIDESLLPSHFSSETLYSEDWVCAVARQSKFGDRLTLKQYLAAEHLIVTTIPGMQNITDKQLAGLGAKRRSSVRMPYFGAALSCLPGTELILTLTNGMRDMVEKNSTLRLVKAPQELRPFHFLMVWHPRLTTDARHTWLREAMRQVSPQEALGQRR
jgi:DNA-binding transcriptional LysR family regulator